MQIEREKMKIEKKVKRDRINFRQRDLVRTPCKRKEEEGWVEIWVFKACLCVVGDIPPPPQKKWILFSLWYRKQNHLPKMKGKVGGRGWSKIWGRRSFNNYVAEMEREQKWLNRGKAQLKLKPLNQRQRQSTWLCTPFQRSSTDQT